MEATATAPVAVIAPVTVLATVPHSPEGDNPEHEKGDSLSTTDPQAPTVGVRKRSGPAVPPGTVEGSGSSPLESLRDAVAGALASDPTGRRVGPPASTNVTVDWGAILRHLQDHPEDAVHMDGESNHTPLHWAIRASSSSDGEVAAASEASASDDATIGTSTAGDALRLRVVQRLLALNPGSAAIRCRVHGRTPLATATAKGAPDPAMVDSETRLVRTLLLADPRALHVKCHRGHNPLALHVLSTSRHQWTVAPPPSLLIPKEEEEQDPQHSLSPSPSPSTAVLEVLARQCTRPQLERALELLVRCNTSALAHLVTREESRATADAKWLGPHNPFPRPSPFLTNRRSDSHQPWPWPWICVLLRAHAETASGTAPPPSRSPRHNRRLLHSTTPGDKDDTYNDEVNEDGSGGGFSLVHAACQIVNCPPTVLYLCVRADPAGARTPLDPRSGEFPYSAVERWAKPPTSSATTVNVTPPSPFAALPPSNCRQVLSLAMLDAAHPVTAEDPEEVVDGQEEVRRTVAVASSS